MAQIVTLFPFRIVVPLSIGARSIEINIGSEIT